LPGLLLKKFDRPRLKCRDRQSQTSPFAEMGGDLSELFEVKPKAPPSLASQPEKEISF
jgi:hypothetical protein